MNVRKVTLISSLILIASTLPGCGSDESTSKSARALDIEIEQRQLNVGEGTVARIDFSFDRDAVENDHRNVVMVVRLGEGLEYREGTAEIKGESEDDKIGPQITTCLRDGSTYLLFDMDRFDVEDAANPSGEADARLALTFDGFRDVGITSVAAKVNYESVIFECGEDFSADVAESVAVD